MRRLGIVLALLALAGAAGAAPTPAGGPLFPPGGGADRTVEIARGEVRLTLEHAAERWWVTSGDGARRLADRAGVEALLARLDGLRTERRVASFGRPLPGAFDDPLVIVRDGHEARIGGPARIPGLVYARAPDGALHLMRPVDLDPAALHLVDRRLFPDGLGVVSEIDVSGPDLVLHASREYGPWRLTAPAPSAADGDRIDAWLARLAVLKGDPAAAPVTPGTGYQTVLTRGRAGTMSVVLTRDGRAVLDGTPLQVEGPPRDLVPDRFDWMRKEVMRVPEAGITGIQIQQGDQSVVLAHHGDTPWEDKSSGRVFRSWTAALFGLMDPVPAVGLWSGRPDALGPPKMEVRFWREAQVAATLELWTDDDGRWWARGGDAVTVFQVPPALPEHLARLF